MESLIFIPLILFFTVVLPVWVVCHYITIWKRERRSHTGETLQQGELSELAQRLEERLAAIESILDTDAPEWRSRT